MIPGGLAETINKENCQSAENIVRQNHTVIAHQILCHYYGDKHITCINCSQRQVHKSTTLTCCINCALQLKTDWHASHKEGFQNYVQNFWKYEQRFCILCAQLSQIMQTLYRNKMPYYKAIVMDIRSCQPSVWLVGA